MKKIALLSALALLLVFSITLYRKREEVALFYRIHAWNPAWAKEQIERDFAHCKAITEKQLEETYPCVAKSYGLSCRYRILGKEIYRKGPSSDPLGRAATFDKILRRIGRSAALPQIDFILCMEDGVRDDRWMPASKALCAPLLAWARKEQVSGVVLIPDILTTKEYSWHREIEGIEKANIAWEQKEPLAFWRGVTNDKGYSEENYQQKPRYLLSLLSQHHPDRIDAGFNRVYPEAVKELFEKRGLLKAQASVPEHLRYKYLPVLDGYMCTYPGFQWRLYSGSVPLKQQSDEIQYFYSALKPYEHYLPVANDMSDLLAQLDWAKEHDPECKEIAAKARRFALSSLQPDMIYAYLFRVLQTYASFQSFSTGELLEATRQDPQWIKVR